ncbi:hypothetical protein PCASD_07164 [Puccinia coronata f. sp. avenae]|uniref:Uncharacterized protein n=1 Tax=Puccinia coronata f. sp. avenae TaxID=200324 RepID=A0A2N5UUL1_9BASI|nr:hypothetical protein PCASD_07164 [Puccinia coronata f. sp. avenae]
MADKMESTIPKADYLPILNGTNYTNWSGRIKVHLQGKEFWDACTTRLLANAANTDVAKQLKAKNEAIAIIIPRLNPRCYNEVVNAQTIDDGILLWDKISAHASFAQASVFVTSTSSVSNNSPIIDSAASHHMICDKLLFNNIVPENIIIKTGHKSNNLFAEGIGSVSVKSVTIEKNANRFVIRDVRIFGIKDSVTQAIKS